jgi:hypothetical protein
LARRRARGLTGAAVTVVIAASFRLGGTANRDETDALAVFGLGDV